VAQRKEKTPIQKLVIGMLINRRNAGFTLIEILVVMLIMSITFGMALLAFGDFGKDRKIRAAAEGFAQFIQLVHERAVLESSTLQITLNSNGYVTKRLTPQNQWRPLKQAFYHPHTLPAKTIIEVNYGSKKRDQLTVIISSTGDMTPFKVYFGSSSHAHLAIISGNENGTILFNQTDTH
jgi:general secretion pathway protein H